MSIVPETNESGKLLKRRMDIFFKRFKLNRILRLNRVIKEKGTSAYVLFAFLFELAFTKKNLYQQMSTNDEIPFKKDAVYRFLEKGNVHWEGIVKGLALSVLPDITKLTSEERRSALIIDDTPFYRNRSKKVELLSWQYDHAEHKNYRGFNMLNMGWSDGQSFVPLDFRLLSASKDKSPICPSKVKEDGRTLATKRRTDARRDKPSHVLEMLSSVRGTPAQAKYVLFDSWFANPAAILGIKRLDYDVVARLKNHNNYRYLYKEQCLPINQIYKMTPKRRGRSRYLLSVLVEIRHEDFEEKIPAKLVFVRDRNNRSKWIALISTDISLTEDEIIALYGKRWDIEPYHKMLKSCLHLTTEFQLRSFDAIVAHVSIVITRYIFLALENRESKDERTLGELFLVICDELQDISFAQSLKLILSSLESFLADRFYIAKALIVSAVHDFLVSLPACFMPWTALAVCES